MDEIVERAALSKSLVFERDKLFCPSAALNNQKSELEMFFFHLFTQQKCNTRNQYIKVYFLLLWCGCCCDRCGCGCCLGGSDDDCTT